MDLHLFDQVGEALRGLLPPELGPWHQQVRRYSVKVWAGDGPPPREHYEAQVVSARHVPGCSAMAVEVGFHAEHPDPAANDEAIARLLKAERRWRNRIGAEAEVGPFLGRPDDWRRISETWPDPDMGDPELVLEIAARLTDYVAALEPLRRR